MYNILVFMGVLFIERDLVVVQRGHAYRASQVGPSDDCRFCSHVDGLGSPHGGHAVRTSSRSVLLKLPCRLVRTASSACVWSCRSPTTPVTGSVHSCRSGVPVSPRVQEGLLEGTHALSCLMRTGGYERSTLYMHCIRRARSSLRRCMTLCMQAGAWYQTGSIGSPPCRDSSWHTSTAVCSEVFSGALPGRYAVMFTQLLAVSPMRSTRPPCSSCSADGSDLKTLNFRELDPELITIRRFLLTILCAQILHKGAHNCTVIPRVSEVGVTLDGQSPRGRGQGGTAAQYQVCSDETYRWQTSLANVPKNLASGVTQQCAIRTVNR